jgi:hypothetical protein
MELAKGIEPPTPSLQVRSSTVELRQPRRHREVVSLKRVTTSSDAAVGKLDPGQGRKKIGEPETAVNACG